METSVGEQFLHQKDPKLHITKPVEHEQERLKKLLSVGAEMPETIGQERLTKSGEKIPVDKIAAWLTVLDRTHSHHDDPRVLERIKSSYHKKYVIKPEDVPQGYFDTQRRLAREQGHGDIELTEDMKTQLGEMIVADQTSTLNRWVDYFSSPDSASFPTWAKYWAFTNMVKLSSYDKEKKAFGNRDKGTVAPFPDLNREALAYVIDAIGKKVHKEHIADTVGNPNLQNLLQGSHFGKLYAYAIEKVTPTQENELVYTTGEWIKYPQNSDHMPLVASLQGHGTGWCTAGESTAQAQLQGGDFYVYYSFDKDGKATIPRVGIRMQGNSIAEVRGIAPQQNLDPYIGEVVEQKLTEFSDGEKYKKKAHDMKFLTALESKMKEGQVLTKEDLTFLYEIDALIEGFGYIKDPRVTELRAQRNKEEDMPIVFGCEPSHIAHTVSEITQATKAYVGKLEPGMFDVLPKGIEYVYTSFFDRRVHPKNISIGGRGRNKLEKEMKAEEIEITPDAQKMIYSDDFTTEKDIQTIKIVTLRVEDLGVIGTLTTDAIHKRAKQLGLSLCPAELGPVLRLADKNQPLDDWFHIAMSPISIDDVNTSTYIFALGHYTNDKYWLCERPAQLTTEWHAEHRFVFRL